MGTVEREGEQEGPNYAPEISFHRGCLKCRIDSHSFTAACLEFGNRKHKSSRIALSCLLSFRARRTIRLRKSPIAWGLASFYTYRTAEEANNFSGATAVVRDWKDVAGAWGY